MGMPIQILDGVNSQGSLYGAVVNNLFTDINQNTQYHAAVLDLLMAKELDNSINGLGSVSEDEAALNYIIKTKNLIVANPDSVAQYQNPIQLVEMLNYAIKYWDTPMRAEALEKLAEKEADLIEDGYISINYMQGFDGVDDDWFTDFEYDIDNETTERGLDYRYTEVQGVNGTETGREYRINGLGGFFRGLKKKFGDAFKKAKDAAGRAADKVKQTAKKATDKIGQSGVWKAIKKYNPLSVTIRNAFLLALKINLFHLADKLAIGFLSASAARSKGLSDDEYRRAVKLKNKVENLHVKKLGGKASSFKKAVLSGKRKFIASLSGLGDVQAIGYLGEPVTAAGSTAAASGVIATVAAWIKKAGINFGSVLKKVFSKKSNTASKPKGRFFPKLKDKFISFKDKLFNKGETTDIDYSTNIPTIESQTKYASQTPNPSGEKGKGDKPKFFSKDWFKKNKKPIMWTGIGIGVLAASGITYSTITRKKRKAKAKPKAVANKNNKAPKSLEGVTKVELK